MRPTRKHLILVVVLLVIAIPILKTTAEPPMPAWANPTKIIIKKVSPVASAQNWPNFMDNLDCGLATYRQPASSYMLSGCFTDTALGLMDSDTETVIFNGSDEGLPLIPYEPGQSIAPWPGTESLLTLSSIGDGSAYLGLYKNALGVLRDQRNASLRIIAKQLIAPPDLQLKDQAGKRLAAHPQTIAFSPGGTWMVAEATNGYFVRINLDSLEATSFAPAYFHPGSPATLKSEVAVSPDGQFVAIANESDLSLKVFDLKSCAETCKYYNYRPYISGQISELRNLRHLRFINEDILSLEVSSNDDKSAGIYELAPEDSLNSLTSYIGLGDSFTSGEGAFDYRSGTDSSTNECHLSARSYPLLLSHDLFNTVGGHSVACSGAVVNDVGSLRDDYRGQAKGVPDFKHLQIEQPDLLNSVIANFAPGYIAQQRFVARYQPQIVTVSIGGNDIGFGNILETCVNVGSCFGTYEDRLEIVNLINRTMPKWTRLYKQLITTSPGTQLYVIGYPQIISDRGSCGLNVHLDQSERELAIELVNNLNSAISRAASSAGAIYVDISRALYGHRLCEGPGYNLAVNGLTAGRDAGFFGIDVFGHESYHPNALGQLLIEQAILKTTHNLNDSAAGPQLADDQDILQAPKNGRQVANRIPSSNISQQLVVRGQPAQLSVDGAVAGLDSASAYSVRLDGSGGQQIGSIESDSQGDINGSVEIPSDISAGGHTIDVVGSGQAGEQLDVTQPIYIPANNNDKDGDGTYDTQDSCPTIENSGEDEDKDGIDDVCDPLVSQAPDQPAKPGGSLVAQTVKNGAEHPKKYVLTSGSRYTKDPQKAHNVHPPLGVNVYKTRLLRFNWLFWLGWPWIAWWLLESVAILAQKVTRLRVGR